MMFIDSFYKIYARVGLKWMMTLALILATFLVYANVLGAPFLWDDEVLVLGNPLIQSLDHVGEILRSDPFLAKADSSRFYRPIQSLVYAFEYAGWKLNPVGFHAVNIGVHTVTVCSVFALLLAFGLSLWPAFLAALWWAIHPLNIEAVTYVSGIGDGLFLMFSIGSIWMWLRALRGQWWGYPLAILGWVLAIFSKEAAFSIPFIMMSYVWIYRHHFSPRVWRINMGVLGGIIGLYLAFRFGALQTESSMHTLSWIAHASLWERCLTLSYMAFMTLKLWFFPFPLHMEYHYVVEGLLDPYVWLGLPVVGVFFWILSRGVERRVFWFWCAWIGFGLAPVSQVFIPMSASFREHWLYLPGIGLSVLCVLYAQHTLLPWGLGRFGKKTVFGFILTGLILFSGVTIYRNLDWRDPFRLYSHDVQYETRSCLLYNNLGVEYFRRQAFEEAKKAFQNAIYMSPDQCYATAYNNYGVLLEQESNLVAAIDAYQKSILYGQYVLAYENLGRLYLRLGRVDLAEPILLEGSHRYPYSTAIQYYLGVAYLQAQRRDKALPILEDLLIKTPGDVRLRLLITQLRG